MGHGSRVKGAKGMDAYRCIVTKRDSRRPRLLAGVSEVEAGR